MLTRAVRTGGICYLDEVVEARKDTTVVIHPLTDDRRILPIDRTGETLQAPDNFMLVVSYNPGYQNLLKGMKPSTRQRFVSMSFDYLPAAAEVEVLLNETAVDKAIAEQLVILANGLRQLKDQDLEEGASTRLLSTHTVISSYVVCCQLRLKALTGSITRQFSHKINVSLERFRNPSKRHAAIC